MAKQNMTFALCAGINIYSARPLYEHGERDGCTTCAPYWEVLNVCPGCDRRLRGKNSDYCQSCRKFYRHPGETPTAAELLQAARERDDMEEKNLR